MERAFKGALIVVFMVIGCDNVAPASQGTSPSLAASQPASSDLDTASTTPIPGDEDGGVVSQEQADCEDNGGVWDPDTGCSGAETASPSASDD